MIYDPHRNNQTADNGRGTENRALISTDFKDLLFHGTSFSAMWTSLPLGHKSTYVYNLREK